MQLVGQRTTQIVSIQTSMAQHIGAAMSGNGIKLLSALDIDAMPISMTDALGMKSYKRFKSRSMALKQRCALHQHCRRDKNYRLLRSVAGIGPVLATVILLETWRHRPPRRCRQLRIVLPLRAERPHFQWQEKGEGNTKNGNRFLAWAYIEAANRQSRARC
jgi:hypothetical protein